MRGFRAVAPLNCSAVNATILKAYGGYSSVAEHRSVAPGVVGSIPTSRPKSDNITGLTSDTLEFQWLLT